MRGLVLIVIYFGLLSQVVKRPYIGILMWFWISLMSPHRFVWGFATEIPYALIVAIVTLASWLLHPEELKAPPGDRTTLLLLAMAVWISVTTLASPVPLDNASPYWVEAEKMLLMTLLAYTMTNTRERFDQLVLVCVLSIAFHGFKGGVYTVLHAGAFRVTGPPQSAIGDNNDLGVALTMTLPLLIYLQQRYTQPQFKWPLRVLTGLTALADLFTYSRAALLAISAVASVFWLRSRQKLVTGIVIAVAVLGVLQFAPEQWFGRMQTIDTYQEDASAQSRLYLWQLSWFIASKHPLTGAGFHWGYDPIWVNRQIAGSGLPPLTLPRAMHSIWFNMVSSQGFIGLVLFIGFFVSTALNAQWLIRRTRGRPKLEWANKFGLMLQVALVGFAVGGSFDNLEMWDGLYALVIMGAAARRIIAAELATPVRVFEPRFADSLPVPATTRVQLGQPAART